MYRVKGILSQNTTEYSEEIPSCSPAELELSVLAGKKTEGGISLRSPAGKKLHCFLYSTHYRMQPQISFAKGEEIYLTYRFDASGLSAGQKVTGQVVILSDLGQLLVPFSVTVSDNYEDERLGSIRNLFHFTNLASKDWKSAMSLFYSSGMEQLLTGHDARLLPLYRSLSAVRDNERNLDEFLISLNKKKPATFSIEDDMLLLPQVYEPQQQTLKIRRKGWGYTHIEVIYDGEYLTGEKKVLTQEDFTNNVCELNVILLPTDGFEHRERIRLKTDSPSGELSCELLRIGKSKKENPRETDKKEKKRQVALLMRAYLDYTTGKGDPKEALSRAEKCIERINQTGGRNISGRLYQTHLLCAMGRFQEAGWIFSHVERVIEKEMVTPTQQAYFWYLQAMLARGNDGDYIRLQNSGVRRLRDLLAGNPQDAIITSLYLRMIPTGQITPVKMLSLYEECYYSGCESPILLREAFRVVAENTAYLSGLGEFEVAMLQFALRYDLLTASLEARIIELVKREKKVTRALLAFLMRLYQGYQEDDMLQAVCGLLIRTGKCDPESLFWFQRAVDKQLRITMLYESYMAAKAQDLSLPPKYVLMYFAYQCHLEKSLKAHLYRIVIEHHTRIGALVDAYDPQIREFAKGCLAAGEKSEDLAYCYKFLLKDSQQIEQCAQYLPVVAFMHRVKVADPKVKRVIVAQSGLEKETAYPVKNKIALVEIYTEDYYLLLEDEEGNRALAPAHTKAERMLPIEGMREHLLSLDEPGSGLSLYRISNSSDDFMKHTEDWPLYMQAARDVKISLPLRLSILERVLRVLYEREEHDTLLSLLSEYPIEGSDEKKRGQIIAYHIGLEQDETALSLLWDYGFEGVPPKSLNRLIRRGLEKVSGADPKWLALTYYTYRQGKYTQELLQYLCNYYEGGIPQMNQIFQDAIAFEVDALPIAERILVAATFTHGYLPQWEQIFDYYASRGGNIQMQKRFLQDLCFRYFVAGEVTSEGSMRHLYAALLEEDDMPQLCKLSWLHAMSAEDKQLDDKQKRLAIRLIRQQLMEKGYMPFFEKYVSIMPELLPYAAKTWLVYRGEPGRRVKVSYLGGPDGEETYQMRFLDELCPGYYAKDFMMFYGDRLHYYIQEENAGEMTLTESGQIEREDSPERENAGRFEMLYDMTMSARLSDEKTAASFAHEYRKADRLTKELFG